MGSSATPADDDLGANCGANRETKGSKGLRIEGVTEVANRKSQIDQRGKEPPQTNEQRSIL